MARGVIPVTTIVRSGVALPAETTGDASNNHTVANDGNLELMIRNSNGASTARTVTFHLPGTVDGLPVTSRVESIPAGETQMFGPFPVSEYGDDLLVDVEHAEIKLRAFHLPNS